MVLNLRKLPFWVILLDGVILDILLPGIPLLFMLIIFRL